MMGYYRLYFTSSDAQLSTDYDDFAEYFLKYRLNFLKKGVRT